MLSFMKFGCCFQVTVGHVYAGQTDGRQTFVYHNTFRQNLDGRIKSAGNDCMQLTFILRLAAGM